MPIGYIKLHRGLSETKMWLKEPFTWGQAWVDLLMAASFKDSHFYVRGNKVKVLRGQTAISQANMGTRWRWSRGKVKRFLNELENEQMIEQQTGQLTTVLSICNYEKYQANASTGEQQTEQQTVQQTEQQTEQQTVQQTVQQTGHIRRSKESKEVKKGKKVKKYCESFQTFWSAYPSNRRGDKSRAAKEWDSLDSSMYNQIVEHVEKRKVSDPDWLKENGKFIVHAERFLRGCRWEDTWQTNVTQFSEKTQRNIQSLKGVSLQ